MKFPKLTLSKFDGSHLDWQRFWCQSEFEINRAELAQVTKFRFLKEALKLKVRVLVDGLPFTIEGYGEPQASLNPNTAKIVK